MTHIENAPSPTQGEMPEETFEPARIASDLVNARITDSDQLAARITESADWLSRTDEVTEGEDPLALVVARVDLSLGFLDTIDPEAIDPRVSKGPRKIFNDFLDTLPEADAETED